MKRKFNYMDSTVDIFYKIIYPLYAKEFLFGTRYDTFAELVALSFMLNNQQWEYILEHWEEKEAISRI